MSHATAHIKGVRRRAAQLPVHVFLIDAAGRILLMRRAGSGFADGQLGLPATGSCDGVDIDECAGTGASEIIVVTRPADTVVAAHLAAHHRRVLPVQVVAEDLHHGYGNATPLLTVGNRLRHCDLFAVAFGDDLLLPSARAHHELASMHRLAARGADAMIAAL